MQQQQPGHIEAVEADDSASELGSLQEESSVASLRSSLLEHQSENGRTYHSMSSGKYSYPNDERENDRLDFQYHIWSIAQDGELALCPAHKKAKRVLDMGTGTGIWAINFADTFPSAEVIGVDLSPIQPGWVPPNCKFEIDDLEKDWTWDKPFDFIYARALEGCFSDIPKMIEKVYKALSPGGWFEVGSLMMPMGCDDGTVPKDSALARWHDLLTEATAKIGRPYTGIATHTKEMEEAGFVNVKHRDFIWPLNSWPKDEHLSEIGRWHCVNLDLALEAMSLALLTRVMDWSKAEVEVFCANVRKDVRNKKMHGYWKIRVLYAQKPLESEEGENPE